MDKNELPKIVTTILNGHNYVLWSQDMRSFLKGHRLWRYVTGEIQAPVRSKDEEDTKFADRLEDWDCKNHQIITWFRHSTVPSIHQQFGRYENAKDVWDLLSRHYTTTGLSHEYQLWGLLVNMKQMPGQPINEFLSGLQSIWDQKEQSTHIVKDPADAAILATKRDQFHLIQFLMALTFKFEPVRATLLQQVPLPTLEFAMSSFSLMRPVFALFNPITLMRSLLLLHVLQALPHLRMVQNIASTVISRDIFWLNARPSNVGIVTRLVTLSTTALPSLPSQVNQAFFQDLLIPLLLLLLKTHPLIPLSHLSRLMS
jgi:hypothetical protein